MPAAATITASFTVAAYQTAAPMALWSSGSAADTHAVTLMLITLAPMLAACTIALASVATVPAFLRASMSPAPGFSGS